MVMGRRRSFGERGPPHSIAQLPTKENIKDGLVTDVYEEPARGMPNVWCMTVNNTLCVRLVGRCGWGTWRIAYGVDYNVVAAWDAKDGYSTPATRCHTVPNLAGFEEARHARLPVLLTRALF
ncbi:unnamed protein product [Ectocarpus sp. 4 AP-2014]